MIVRVDNVVKILKIRNTNNFEQTGTKSPIKQAQNRRINGYKSKQKFVCRLINTNEITIVFLNFLFNRYDCH